MTVYDNLTISLTRYVSIWRKTSRFYAAISIALKLTLILLSALTASKLFGVDWSKDGTHGAWASFLVAIGTAIDAWLKPRDKWKGFMGDHEHGEDILMRLKAIDPADATQVDQLRTEFQKLLETHREKNVF